MTSHAGSRRTPLPTPTFAVQSQCEYTPGRNQRLHPGLAWAERPETVKRALTYVVAGGLLAAAVIGSHTSTAETTSNVDTVTTSASASRQVIKLTLHDEEGNLITSVAEGDGESRVFVRASYADGQARSDDRLVGIHYGHVGNDDQTAIYGTDYLITGYPGRVTIPAGDLSAVASGILFNLDGLLDDHRYEGNETIAFNGNVYYYISEDSISTEVGWDVTPAVLTITDNDSPPTTQPPGGTANIKLDFRPVYIEWWAESIHDAIDVGWEIRVSNTPSDWGEDQPITVDIPNSSGAVFFHQVWSYTTGRYFTNVKGELCNYDRHERFTCVDGRPLKTTHLADVASAVCSPLACDVNVVSVSPDTHRFLDVPPDHPVYESVEAATGVLSGITAGLFVPDMPLMRSEAAVVVARLIAENTALKNELVALRAELTAAGVLTTTATTTTTPAATTTTTTVPSAPPSGDVVWQTDMRPTSHDEALQVTDFAFSGKQGFFTYSDRTYQLHSIQVNRRGARVNATPGLEDHELPDRAVFRFWPSGKPSEVQTLRLGDAQGMPDSHHWDLIWDGNERPLDAHLDLRWHIELAVPAASEPPEATTTTTTTTAAPPADTTTTTTTALPVVIEPTTTTTLPAGPGEGEDPPPPVVIEPTTTTTTEPKKAAARAPAATTTTTTTTTTLPSGPGVQGVTKGEGWGEPRYGRPPPDRVYWTVKAGVRPG